MPNIKMIQKIYCYVDETGQDTQGDLFIVSVVVTELDRDKIISHLEKIEKSTGKGRRKWSQTKNRQRHEYIDNILNLAILKGKLNYAIYRQTTDYLARTILTVARAITACSIPEYKAVIFMDGLPKSQVKWFGSELRHLKIRTEKVRGVRKEENDAIARLADAVCGFVRKAVGGKKELKNLLRKAKSTGSIKEI